MSKGRFAQLLKPFSSARSVLLFALLGSLLVMLSWIWSPALNLEYVFLQAAQSLIAPDGNSPLEEYFVNQANPLGMSLLASFAIRLMPVIPELVSSRIPNIVGMLLIIFLGWLGFQRSQFGLGRLFLWASFVTFNPILLPYAIRLSADLLPAALIFAAFIVTKQVVEKHRMTRLWLAPALVLSAATLKYNSLYFLLGIAPLLISSDGLRRWTFNKRNLPVVFYGMSLGLIAFALFVTWQYRASGVLLLSSEYRSRHSLGSEDALTPFSRGLRYLAILSLLVSPMLIGHISSTYRFVRKLTISLIVGIPIFFLARLDDPTGGELDFGGLIPRGSWPDQFLIFVGCVLAPLLVWTLLRVQSSGGALLLLTYVLVPLIVMSLARPAQRYLIPLVLIVSFMLATKSAVAAPKRLVQWFAVVLMTIPCFGLVGYQNSTAVAADRMAQWIRDHQLLEVTKPNDIQAHANLYWVGVQETEPRYKVVKVSSSEKCQSHQTEISLFGLSVGKYCLNQS
jgi:hypothetical protein